MSTPIAMEDLLHHLPARIWYLTGNGEDIYCRRPYTFLFSSGGAARSFAEAFVDGDLTAVGVDRDQLSAQDLAAAFHSMQVTRVFIDPSIDPESGDVFGDILRFAEPN